MGKTMTDALMRVIAKQAHLDPSVIKPEFVLSELGITSLDLVEIIMTIEDEYNVTIRGDGSRPGTPTRLSRTLSSWVTRLVLEGAAVQHQPIVVTGAGCVSALGHSVAAFWSGPQDGRCGPQQTRAGRTVRSEGPDRRGHPCA